MTDRANVWPPAGAKSTSDDQAVWPPLIRMPEAGDAVARRAPGEAVCWYRAAVDLLPEGPSPEAAALWRAMGRTLGAAGHLADARSALVRAIEMLPEGALTDEEIGRPARRR